MTMFDDEIGKKIAVIRKSRNVSAEDLSIAIGRKSDYVYRIEKGYFKPSTAPFFDICEHLDFSPTILLNTNLEQLEKYLEFSLKMESLDKNERKKVMDDFFAIVEEKMAEALQETENT